MELPRFSQMLYTRREQLGLTIDQASRVLKLKEQVLIAFEEGDFAAIPKSGYAQGMLSSYARYLGLNPREVVDQFSEDLYEYSTGTTSHELRRRTRASRGDTGVISNSGILGSVDSTGSLSPLSDGPDTTGSFDTTSLVNVRSQNRGRPSPLVNPHGAGAAPRPGADMGRRVPSVDESGYIVGGPTYGPQDPYGAPQGSYQGGRFSEGVGTPVPRSSGFDSQSGYTGSTPQARPYTSRVPQQTQRASRAYSRRSQSGPYVPDDVDIRGASNSGRGHSDVVRRRVQPNQYEDDLVFDDETTQFVGASSAAGRRSSRNIASTERPNVARSSREERRALRDRSIRQDGSIFERIAAFFSDRRHTIGLVMALVALVLMLIIVMSIRSCVVASSGRRRAVTEITSPGSSVTQSAGSAAQSTTAAPAKEEPTETKVVVSLPEGAVSWVEIESDGASIVADTLTGPWEQEIVVDNSITIQVGDITAVSVTKNGDPVQFTSKASGVGTLTIEGPNAGKTQSTEGEGTSEGGEYQAGESVPVEDAQSGEQSYQEEYSEQ